MDTTYWNNGLDPHSFNFIRDVSINNNPQWAIFIRVLDCDRLDWSADEQVFECLVNLLMLFAVFEVLGVADLLSEYFAICLCKEAHL